ncbi:MAG: O-antigen ligase family protein [Ruminococcaceae bacterium]|nr:O-antigen ligase family protein [Oscillospiraceae bacterium]
MLRPMRSRALASRAAYLCACAFVTVFYLFLPFGGYLRMMEGKTACFFALSIGCLAAVVCAAPADKPRMTPMRCCVWAYLGFSALSALFSPFGTKTLLGGTRNEGLLVIALYVGLFFCFARYAAPDRRLLYLAASAVSLCALLVLVQTAGYDPFGLYPKGLNYYDGDVAYAGFFAGTSGNADFTAFLLALALSAMLAAMLREKLWQLSPAIVLAVAALLRLGISGPLLGLGFAALWSPALLWPEKKRAMLLLSAALSVCAMAFVFFYDGGSRTLWEASRLLHGEADDAFGSGRLAIWRACVPLIRERPLFGGGPDTLWLRGMEPFAWRHEGIVTPSDITAAHNEYLNILVNQGAFALAAYLALLALALVRCFRRAEEPRYAVCGVALLCYAAMAMFSISSCITAPFVWMLLAYAQDDGTFDAAESDFVQRAEIRVEM